MAVGSEPGNTLTWKLAAPKKIIVNSSPASVSPEMTLSKHIFYCKCPLKMSLWRGTGLMNALLQKKAEPGFQPWRGLQPQRTPGAAQSSPSRMFSEVDLSDSGPRTPQASSRPNQGWGDGGRQGWEGAKRWGKREKGGRGGDEFRRTSPHPPLIAVTDRILPLECKYAIHNQVSWVD